MGLANNPLHIAQKIESTLSLSVLASACYERIESRSVCGSHKGQTPTPDLAAWNARHGPLLDRLSRLASYRLLRDRVTGFEITS